MYSGITRGRVLSGKHYMHKDYTNLSAFIYRQFHDNFTSIDVTNLHETVCK